MQNVYQEGFDVFADTEGDPRVIMDKDHHNISLKYRVRKWEGGKLTRMERHHSIGHAQEAFRVFCGGRR